MSINTGPIQPNRGTIRPLQPAAPQQQQPLQPDALEQQTPNRAGGRARALANVRHFSHQPVDHDLLQVQQWLNSLRNADQPGRAAAPPPQPQAPAAEQQQVQINSNTQTVAAVKTVAAAKTGQEDPPLNKSQKAELARGVSQLAEQTGSSKADASRLVHARALGNEQLLNHHLGAIKGISLTSPQGQSITNAIDGILHKVDGSLKGVAERMARTIVLDETGQLANSLNVTKGLAVDLGALTHNEEHRFMELARASGVDEQTADKMLQGFAKLAQEHDLSPQKLDQLLGESAQAINNRIGKQLKQVAAELKLDNNTMMRMANAVLSKNTQGFITAGRDAGLDNQALKQLLPQVKKSMAELQSGPAISGNKLLRYTRNAVVQNELISTGKEFKVNPDHSLLLASAYLDGGQNSFQTLAGELGLQAGADKLLQGFKKLEASLGQDTLRLATNNAENIIAQNRLMRDMALQQAPVQWQTSLSAPIGQPMDFLNTVATMQQASTAPSTPPPSLDVAIDQVRHVALEQQQQELEQRMESLLDQRKEITLPHLRAPLEAEIENIQKQLEELHEEADTIQSIGHAPNTEQAERMRLGQQLAEQEQSLAQLQQQASVNPFMTAVYAPHIAMLEDSIESIEARLY